MQNSLYSALKIKWWNAEAAEYDLRLLWHTDKAIQKEGIHTLNEKELQHVRIKEEIWLSPMTKVHTPTEMSIRQSDNKNATKKFDYTAVADRLRTVSWSNYGLPTGVVNLVYGPNLPTPRNSRVIKRTMVILSIPTYEYLHSHSIRLQWSMRKLANIFQWMPLVTLRKNWHRFFRLFRGYLWL